MDSDEEPEVEKVKRLFELRQEKADGYKSEILKRVRVNVTENKQAHVLGLDAAVEKGTAERLLNFVESNLVSWDIISSDSSGESMDDSSKATIAPTMHQDM